MNNEQREIAERVAAMSISDVMSELASMTNGKASRWRSVHYEVNGETVSIRDVAYLPDGSIEANGKDSELVARAILKALEVDKVSRSRSAKKAAATRAVRRERKIYAIVNHIKAGGQFTPSSTCRVCGKAVSDQESHLRGIGPDCWQEILRKMEALTAAA
jgi:hypothetical protein